MTLGILRCSEVFTRTVQQWAHLPYHSPDAPLFSVRRALQLLGGQVAVGSGAPARHPRAGGPPPVRAGDLPGTGRGPGPPLRRRGSGPPLPGGTRRTEWGAPPGGSGRGGRSPTVTPPGVTPPSGGVKNAVFGRHLVLYNLVGFFPVLISGCGRIFGRGK